MFDVICYKQSRTDGREREIERLTYPLMRLAEKAAEGLTTLEFYDRIEVEDDMGFIRITYTRDRSGYYQKGF